jgi:hypothetical protein
MYQYNYIGHINLFKNIFIYIRIFSKKVSKVFIKFIKIYKFVLYICSYTNDASCIVTVLNIIRIHYSLLMVYPIFFK